MSFSVVLMHTIWSSLHSDVWKVCYILLLCMCLMAHNTMHVMLVMLVILVVQGYIAY